MWFLVGFVTVLVVVVIWIFFRSAGRRYRVTRKFIDEAVEHELDNRLRQFFGDDWRIKKLRNPIDIASFRQAIQDVFFPEEYFEIVEDEK